MSGVKRKASEELQSRNKFVCRGGEQDFLIIHSSGDQDRATDLCKRIRSFGYCGSVYDGNGMFLSRACSKVRYVLMCVSHSFGDESFIEYKGSITRPWLLGARFRIIAVHLDSQIDLVNEYAKRHFLSLMRFTNLYVWSKDFEMEVRKEFEKYKRWRLRA